MSWKNRLMKKEKNKNKTGKACQSRRTDDKTIINRAEPGTAKKNV